MSSPEILTSTGLPGWKSSCFQRIHASEDVPVAWAAASLSTSMVASSLTVFTSSWPKLRSGMCGAYRV